jgi:hypothetical protein
MYVTKFHIIFSVHSDIKSQIKIYVYVNLGPRDDGLVKLKHM